MPPITRRQSKKIDPYSKENRQSEKRSAFSDLNNVSIFMFYLFLYIPIGFISY